MSLMHLLLAAAGGAEKFDKDFLAFFHVDNTGIYTSAQGALFVKQGETIKKIVIPGASFGKAILLQKHPMMFFNCQQTGDKYQVSLPGSEQNSAVSILSGYESYGPAQAMGDLVVLNATNGAKFQAYNLANLNAPVNLTPSTFTTVGSGGGASVSPWDHIFVYGAASPYMSFYYPNAAKTALTKATFTPGYSSIKRITFSKHLKRTLFMSLGTSPYGVFFSRTSTSANSYSLLRGLTSSGLGTYTNSNSAINTSPQHCEWSNTIHSTGYGRMALSGSNATGAAIFVYASANTDGIVSTVLTTFTVGAAATYGAVHSVSWSKDDKYLAITTAKGYVQFWKDVGTAAAPSYTKVFEDTITVPSGKLVSVNFALYDIPD